MQVLSTYFYDKNIALFELVSKENVMHTVHY